MAQRLDAILVVDVEATCWEGDPPPGQISHVAYKTDEGLKVIDVWDSAESFAAMGEKLMPILQNLGINTGAPITYNLYNLLKTNN